MKKLQVGDRIYAISYNKIVGAYKIERVTATQAIDNKGQRFKIDYADESGWINQVAREKWSTTSYYIETDTLKERWYRQRAKARITSFDYDKLSSEELHSILIILKEDK